jgi:hypothetical protein
MFDTLKSTQTHMKTRIIKIKQFWPQIADWLNNYVSSNTICVTVSWHMVNKNSNSICSIVNFKFGWSDSESPQKSDQNDI